jgi:hypothetical protein
MESLRNNLETRQQQLEAATAKEEEEKKAGFWSRLFGK